MWTFRLRLIPAEATKTASIMCDRVFEMTKIMGISASTGQAQSKINARSRGGRIANRLVTNHVIGQELPAAELNAAPSRKKQRARGDDARERILQAALECFGAFGFEGTSTRAVADRAGSTHTSILYHFQSKEQLWIATMENILGKYMAEINVAPDSGYGMSAKDALAKFIEQFFRMSARLPQVHRILTMESNQGTQRLSWIVEHFLRDHFNTVRDLIRRGQAEGRVRQCDPARLYYLIIGAGGTPFTTATEYRALTGRDVFSDAEILRIIAFIYEIVFE
jgi:TetR/AcrR family transcriptional regulator